MYWIGVGQIHTVMMYWIGVGLIRTVSDVLDRGTTVPQCLMDQIGIGQIHTVSDGLDSDIPDRGRTDLHCQ